MSVRVCVPLLQPDVMYSLPTTMSRQAVAFGTSTRNDWEATRMNKRDTYNPNGTTESPTLPSVCT